MANQRRNEDQEQITDDNVVGKAVGEEEDLEDADEADEFDEDDEEENDDVGEE
jgi:hypothetical protein